MNERKVFQDSIVPIHADAGLTLNGLMVNAAKPENLKEKMTLHFSLEIPPTAQADLEEKVAKGEVVSPEELQKSYSPDPADIQKLESWLKKEGFEVLKTQHDGSSIYATASVAQIEKSLAVKMVRVTKEGITYTAAQNAPSLPTEISQSVHAIIGLQPFRKMYKHFRSNRPNGDNRVFLKANKKPAEGAAASPSPNIKNTPPYLVPEILKAYNADGLGVTGKGQVIAILIDTFPADADIQAFWNANQIPCTLQQLQKINVTGVAPPPPEGEETLDVSWSSGIAPGATIRIYATGALSFVSLDMALDKIIADLSSTPGLRQLSISLGLGEQFMGGANGEVATQHQKFLKLAAAGVNVFVSSGDAGSNPDATGHSPTGPTQAEYESSDSCVIGVGGTSLSLNVDGTVATETAWASGGGGQSIFFDRPTWQIGSGVPAGNKRLIPDVSLVADPNTGAFLVLHGNVTQIGGTSWSAPTWAGFCALINEARSNAGKPPLPFLNPLIYPLLGSTCFRDILVGNNGAFNAGPGYDMVTGIGVPNMEQLVEKLIE
jgi:kumamolisin